MHSVLFHSLSEITGTFSSAANFLLLFCPGPSLNHYKTMSPCYPPGPALHASLLGSLSPPKPLRLYVYRSRKQTWSLCPDSWKIPLSSVCVWTWLLRFPPGSATPRCWVCEYVISPAQTYLTRTQQHSTNAKMQEYSGGTESFQSKLDTWTWALASQAVSMSYYSASHFLVLSTDTVLELAHIIIDKNKCYKVNISFT